MSQKLPSLTAAKAEAKALRSSQKAEGIALSHAKALELIAKRYGFRDWNTCKASLPDLASSLVVGGRVKGSYLSQPFAASVVRAEDRGNGWTYVALGLDYPVDVVRFDSFSSLRQRVQAVIGPNGHTRECTSDGVPHVVLDIL